MVVTQSISEPHEYPSFAKRRAPALAPLLALIALLYATAVSLAAANPQAHAHAAHMVDGNASGHLHLVKAEGSLLIEEGPFSGVLAGSIRAELKTGAVFQGRFTIHTQRGSISGTGIARPHGAGRYQSFAGAFQATGGSGAYAHVSGHSRLYGVFDRRTDSFVVQTSGSFNY